MSRLKAKLLICAACPKVISVSLYKSGKYRMHEVTGRPRIVSKQGLIQVNEDVTEKSMTISSYNAGELNTVLVRKALEEKGFNPNSNPGMIAISERTQERLKKESKVLITAGEVKSFDRQEK